ncbi:MAG: hypothetical protein U1E65_35525 [Myxococcota bacterium]
MSKRPIPAEPTQALPPPYGADVPTLLGLLLEDELPLPRGRIADAETHLSASVLQAPVGGVTRQSAPKVRTLTPRTPLPRPPSPGIGIRFPAPIPPPPTELEVPAPWPLAAHVTWTPRRSADRWLSPDAELFLAWILSVIAVALGITAFVTRPWVQ